MFLVAMNYLWLRERVDRYLSSGMLRIEGTCREVSSRPRVFVRHRQFIYPEGSGRKNLLANALFSTDISSDAMMWPTAVVKW